MSCSTWESTVGSTSFGSDVETSVERSWPPSRTRMTQAHVMKTLLLVAGSLNKPVARNTDRTLSTASGVESLLDHTAGDVIGERAFVQPIAQPDHAPVGVQVDRGLAPVRSLKAIAATTRRSPEC